MRRYWIVAALAALSACGGHSGGSKGPACTVLGSVSPLISSSDALQVQLEVRFLELSDTFLNDFGVDFTIVLAPQSAGQPGFGGAFKQRNTYAVPGGVIADVVGADILVPNGHRPGSYLPNGYVIGAPGLGMGASFVQAPGEDDQCLDVDALLRFLVTGGNVPATTAIVPNGVVGLGLGIAAARFDEVQLGLLLDAISTTAGAEVISAPRVTVFNNQRVISVIQDGQAPASDLLPIVTSQVYAGAAIDFVTSGITLDVRPTINPTADAITLTMRPLSHAVVATLLGTHQVDGNPVTVQAPILVPTTVVTTVSVPDGGTILIGGIKNLADDGKSGEPLLYRLPYINRLFQSSSPLANERELMIMITPMIVK